MFSRKRISNPAEKAILLMVLIQLSAFVINGQFANKPSKPGARNLPGVENRYALVVGVQDYGKETGITSFSAGGPNNDAIELGRALKSYAEFPESKVVILSSNLSEEYQPTANNIYVKLADLLGMAPPDSLFVFAFSGHGIEKNGETYLLAKDSRLRGNVPLLQSTAVELSKIKLIIANSRVKRVILLLDSCRNDPTSAKGSNTNPLSPSTVKSLTLEQMNAEIESFAVFFATRVRESSFISVGKNPQSYFSSAIVEGLSGKAADKDHKVTFGNLVNYVSSVVPERVKRDGFGPQEPFVNSEGFASDLVLSRFVSTPNGLNVMSNQTASLQIKDFILEAKIHKDLGDKIFTNGTRTNDFNSFDTEMYKALLEYRLAEGLQPENGGYRIDAATVLSRLGRYNEAVVKFREGIRLGPDDLPWYHNELCVALRRLSHYDEADLECIKAVKDPNNREFQDELEQFLKKAEQARSSRLNR